jgi:hypothetical protein
MLDRLERALERLVEGSMATLFRLRVQPAEIGRQLERAMLHGRANSVGATLAPNLFEVRLHPEDARVFSGWEDALCREMETWLADLAFAHGLATVGPIQVQVTEDTAVPRRSVRARAQFSASGSPSPAATATHVAPGGPRPLLLRPCDPDVSWQALTSRPITVGRAANNDLVLADAEVSRHHARLEPHGAGWRVVDLGSTNGTWVNGGRIAQAEIGAGDDIAFGGVRFRVAAA